jgi:hypothetical protein
MRTHLVRTFTLAAAALVLSVTAQAQGNGKSKGKKASASAARPAQVVTRDGRIIRDDHYDNGKRVPPGLAKKPGQMPPGQYKKRYGTNEGADVLGGILRRRGYPVLRIVPSGQSQYVYYRMRDGSQRRAIVSPGTDRLSFQNVPASLLQEVLAKLY